MGTSGGLSGKGREQIFGLFAFSEKLKFSSIEKETGIRSNKLSYHLEKMMGEGILQKKSGYYCLTGKGEKYIPVINHLASGEMSPLPIVLVAIVVKDSIALIRRVNRPYKNYLALIGGKIRFEETLKEAAERLAWEKAGILGGVFSLNAIAHEQVMSEKSVKHSFMLFFAKILVSKKSELKKNVEWYRISRLRQEDIIPSDYWLIRNKLGSRIKLDSFAMEEKEEKIVRFRKKR